MNQILFIDDDQFIATLYKNKLEQEGFKVTTALDGTKALEVMQSMQPDAIVLDLHLPDISGADLLQTIRSTQSLKKTPVLVLSTGYIKSLIEEISPLEVHGIFIKSQSPPRVIIAELRKILPEPVTTSPTSANPYDILAGVEAPAPLRTFLESDSAETQRAALRRFYLEIREMLNDAFKASEPTRRTQLARAFQALLEDLYDHPERISLSTKQTLATGFKHLTQDSPGQRTKAMPDTEVMLRGVISSL